jgi:hypothetical protein
MPLSGRGILIALVIHAHAEVGHPELAFYGALNQVQRVHRSTTTSCAQRRAGSS